MAGADKLESFGVFSTIDFLVRSYNGVYNHDDIFNMDVAMVQNMILLNKRQSYISARADEIRDSMNKAKK